MGESILVCSHNTLKGPRKMSVEVYRDVQPDILCLQEGFVGEDGQAAIDCIAEQMGPCYRGVFNAGGYVHSSGILYDAFGIVYNSDEFECVEGCTAILPLAKIEKIPWLENLFWIRGEVTHRHAMAVRLRQHGGEPFTLINFHFYAEGDNALRRRQAEGLADALVQRGWVDHLVLAGDTNAVGFRRRTQRRELQQILEPFSRFGVQDLGEGPTHFFSRLIAHKIPVLRPMCGLIGHFDPDRRYDVVATNLSVLATAKWGVKDSDHDMVGAWIEFNAA